MAMARYASAGTVLRGKSWVRTFIGGPPQPRVRLPVEAPPSYVTVRRTSYPFDALSIPESAESFTLALLDRAVHARSFGAYPNRLTICVPGLPVRNFSAPNSPSENWP